MVTSPDQAHVRCPKQRLFDLLVKLGFKEIEIGFRQPIGMDFISAAS